jgi:hypothetical protein
MPQTPSSSKRTVIAGIATGIIVSAILCVVLLSRSRAAPVHNAALPERPVVVEAPQLLSRGAPAPKQPTVVSQGLRVLVQTKDLKPLQGVRITASSSDSVFLSEEETKSAVETSPEGYAPLVAGGDEDLVLLVKNGFLPKALRRKSIAPQDGVVAVQMDRGNEVEGFVVDPSGRPISDATVEARGRFGGALSLASMGAAGSRAASDLQTGVTDSDGRVRISGITSFPIEMAASKLDYIAIGGKQAGYPRSQTGETVRMVLAPLVRLALSVVDSESGAPVGTAAVAVTNPAEYERAEDTRTSRRPTGPQSGWTEDHAIHWSAWVPLDLRGRLSRDEVVPPDTGGSEISLAISAIGYQTQVVSVAPTRPMSDGTVPITVVRLVRDPRDVEMGKVRFHVDCTPALPPRTLVLAASYRLSGQAEDTVFRFPLSLDQSGTGEALLPVGSYRFRMEAVGIASFQESQSQADPATVQRDTTIHVSLRLTCSRIRAVFADERGIRLPGYLVTVAGPTKGKSRGPVAYIGGEAFAGHDTWAATRADRSLGSIDLLLAPGFYGFHFSHAGFEDHVETLELAPGEDRILHLKLVQAK